MKIKTDNIFQITEVEVSPSKVYKALLDEETHSAFTGMEVEMNPKVGGLFSAFDGDASGIVLDLVKDKRIVLSWRHTDFPEGVYSIVHIDLEKTNEGVRINFNHIGVPEALCGLLTESWRKVYWSRLKDYLEERVLH